MKKRFLFILASIILLSSCSQAGTQDVAVTGTATVTPSSSPSDTPSFTLTVFPTVVPSLTLTSSPSPMPSLTPTFDVARAETVTRAAPEQCPKPSNVSPESFFHIASSTPDYDPAWNGFEATTLNYLNAGGDVQMLFAYFYKVVESEGVYLPRAIQVDLTDDGIPELVFKPDTIYIFGCRSGKYHTLFRWDSYSYIMNWVGEQVIAIRDANMDGVPEIVLGSFGCGGNGAGQCLWVDMLEWNGSEFASLFPTDKDGKLMMPVMIGGRMHAWLPDIRLDDIDHNGTLELILTGNIPFTETYAYRPWRDEIDTYMWDGKYFTPFSIAYSAPQYRYQAVQDGDRAALAGDYEAAINFYSSAIDDPGLKGWSRALFDFGREYPLWSVGQGTPTPVPPLVDMAEYPNLAAYSNYRLMLVYILMGDEASARAVYDKFPAQFNPGRPGYDYVLLAKAFWDEYQSTGLIGPACNKAVAYASLHQAEILTYIGSEYHNISQDIIYTPQDICPFH